MVQIIWTNESKKDLKQIKDFISLDSPFYAQLTIDKIIEKVEVLKTKFYTGKQIPEIDDFCFREILYKNYRIMYKIVSEKQIDILSIFHSSRNFENSYLFK
jgi:toxin ParE1/3/4